VDKHQFAASISDHQRLLKLGAAGFYIGELPKTATGKVLKREIEIPDRVAAAG
jgi:hypothetical protein